MSEVVRHEFGKEERDHRRLLLRLVSRLEDREAAMRADPVTFIKMAHEEIVRLHALIAAAENALRIPPLSLDQDDCNSPRFNTITVDRDEWSRLKACAEVVKDAKRWG